MKSTTALPLRVEFTLSTPWCPPDKDIHLDGLIGWAMVEEAQRQGRAFDDFDEILANLPFDRHECTAGWVWKASYVRPVKVLGSERRYMTTKTAVHDLSDRMAAGEILGRELAAIDTVRGPFKNDAFFYTIEHVPACVAYCVGDPERITSLLDHVTHLGRRGRLDHGAVASFNVTQDASAIDAWQQRQMPAPVADYLPVIGRLRPPYWKGEDQTTVWRPPV